MQFAVVTAFLRTEEILPLAVAADELGYRSLTVADHVVDLESIRTPYPYTPDGSRRWARGTDWPDPWVLIGALGTVTRRLRFFTSIYVAAMRNPYQVAKTVGTAAVLTGGRVALGVGVGWCREEFELLGADFATRGRRTDEALALIRRLWEPGWTECDGEFYPTPRLEMLPAPTEPVPVYVGGLSDVALRRAARHDGWVGDVYRVEEAIAIAQRLIALRRELGVADRPFEVIPALSDAVTPDDFARAAAGGVTQVMTVPWVYYHGFRATLEQKLDGLRRFRDDVMAPLSSGTP